MKKLWEGKLRGHPEEGGPRAEEEKTKVQKTHPRNEDVEYERIRFEVLLCAKRGEFFRLRYLRLPAATSDPAIQGHRYLRLGT